MKTHRVRDAAYALDKTKPNIDYLCFSIYFQHYWHLSIFLLDILLIEANCIDPDESKQRAPGSPGLLIRRVYRPTAHQAYTTQPPKNIFDHNHTTKTRK